MNFNVAFGSQSLSAPPKSTAPRSKTGLLMVDIGAGNIQFLGKYIDDDGKAKKAIIWD